MRHDTPFFLSPKGWPGYYQEIYHIKIAATAPVFTAHGIMHFDTEIACRGYNIIGMKTKQLPTISNDKIDIIGNTPEYKGKKQCKPLF